MIAPHDETVSEQSEEKTNPSESSRAAAQNPSEKTEEETPASRESAAAENPSGTLEKPAETAPAEELPEQIELTPEIIEDEALRNDFMLRLAVVLLAVLFACTQIGETRTLVHVKAGEYMASHGVLPPRTDVFTYTAADQPWVNLSWLFDLFSAGVYAVGGAIALTVVKALIAGVTFYALLKAVKRDVPSWWASICAGLALVVCAGQLTFEPQLITLLGLSLTLWIVLRWQRGGTSASLWPLVPVFLLWCNMDPRAFFGLVVVMLLALGEVIGMFVGRGLVSDDAKRTQLWLIVPVSIGVFFINPFFWQSLISPASLYGREYPAWRDLMELAGGSLHSYLPLFDPGFWKNLTLPVITALVLAATVPVTFALNWRNVTPAHGLLFLGMAGLGLANSHDLAAVSLVFALLAALNAQEWFAESFRQSYSIELSERVFSVGGRAVTALAFFGLAFLAITGRLLGSESNRLGFGFRPALANLIEGFRQDLADTEVPGNGYNFSISQGDVLIWLDRKPFIDSRLNVFTQGGDENLFAQHRRIVEALLPAAQNPDETNEAYQAKRLKRADFLQKKYEELHITYAVVPLGPQVAEYGALFGLIHYADWRMIRLGSMAGWFYHYDFANPDPQHQAKKYLAAHELDVFQEAFRPPEKVSEKTQADEVGYFARSPSFTDKLFGLRSHETHSADALLAWHYRAWLTQYLMPRRASLMNSRDPGNLRDIHFMGQMGMALAYLSIRHANQALKENPNSTLAYRALGESCLQLDMLEQQTNQLFVGQPLQNHNRRFYQAVAAYSQASVAAPDNAGLHQILGNIYSQNNRYDLAIREFERYLEIAGLPEEGDEEAQETYERRLRIIKDLKDKVAQVQTNIDKAIEQKTPAAQLAGYAKNNGCVLLALKLLENAEEGQQPNPILSLFRASLQLEAGQIEEAYQTLGQLEGMMKEQSSPMQSPPGHDLIAMSALVVGEYERAIDLWTTQVKELEENTMLAVLGTLPMANRPVDPPLFTSIRENWASANWQMAWALTQQVPHVVDKPLFDAALSDLELGRSKEAAQRLKQLLEASPESEFRPLAVLYIGQTIGESVEVMPPSAFVPTWPGMFAPGPAIAEKPEKQKLPKPAEAEKPNETEKEPRTK